MKALIISHAHPDFSVGGAEIAAYNLFKSIKALPEVSQAIFLAATNLKSLPSGVIALRREQEYLWKQSVTDWFRLSAANISALTTHFREFLLDVSPDVVFAHHYVHLGIEILHEIRRTLPDCSLIVTLHEFVAICHRNGQMIKTRTNKLCYRESIEDCHLCFPERTPQDFWLRKHYIQKHFESAHMFVAPSKFLKERYVQWGIPEESITVIENGQMSGQYQEDGKTSKSKRSSFGFFGQITEYKGVEVFLQAIHMIEQSARQGMNFEIHGANLEMQGEWLQELIHKLRAPLMAEGVLRWVGPYEHVELPRRMRRVDWVVVPSIWWENSPMVIQEAFVQRKPVICSGIGGMAEKVRHKIDGLHFEVGNPLSLAEALMEAAARPELWLELERNIARPLTYSECGEQYLQLARQLSHAESGWEPSYGR